MLAYFEVGSRVKEVLDTPGCRLKIHCIHAAGIKPTDLALCSLLATAL